MWILCYDKRKCMETGEDDRMKEIRKPIGAVLLAAAMICTACGAKTEIAVPDKQPVTEAVQPKETEREEESTQAVESVTATLMRLRKYIGDVGIADEKGDQVSLLENMKLYSGYHMNTEEVSYAWIDLDDVKLAKMDEITEIDIKKEEKELEIQLESGSLFFHVAKPLEEDESMNIRTSSMIVGIRGTSGWVTAEEDGKEEIHVLEGTVQVSAEDGSEPVAVSSGQYAEITKTDDVTEIQVGEFSPLDIPAYVFEDVVENEVLVQEILEASGMNMLRTEALQQSYASLLDQYREACLVDHGEWMGNSVSYGAQFAPVGIDTMLYYHMTNGSYNILYAYEDIDGNGTPELFIGTGADVNQAYPTDMYVFDGTAVIRVGSSAFEILADGTYLETDPAANIVAVQRLAEDGYTLQDVSVPGLEKGQMITDWTFADFGGKKTFDWKELNE